MRQIFLDTETTGLDPAQGHRIIEIAAVEMVNRRFTGNHFHRYLNPDREIDAGALQVHGISLEFLQDKPRFKDIAQEFIEYITDAELVIHNAPFDIGFLNHEFSLQKLDGTQAYCAGVVDTLRMAKEFHPGQKNNLDALCKRYQVDNSSRTLHGALVDAELLAEVYIAMTRGQETLGIDLDESMGRGHTLSKLDPANLVVLAASDDELETHREYLEELDKASKGNCMWK
jgi:DNA polymerase-3 subunit epsilon